MTRNTITGLISALALWAVSAGEAKAVIQLAGTGDFAPGDTLVTFDPMTPGRNPFDTLTDYVESGVSFNGDTWPGAYWNDNEPNGFASWGFSADMNAPTTRAGFTLLPTSPALNGNLNVEIFDSLDVSLGTQSLAFNLAPNGGFLGIKSSTAFDRIVMTINFNDTFNIDDFRAGYTPGGDGGFRVPEPVTATTGLVAGGLFALERLVRARRKS